MNYGLVYMHKETGIIAEVWPNTWFGDIFYLDFFDDRELLGKMSREGRVIFSDMPMGKIEEWEFICQL